VSDHAAIVAGLRAHPDAGKPSDNDPTRARGFQEFTVFDSGRCSVLYHWGRRTFADLGEVQGWLLGQRPNSWQE
jgi:hypothetical protein